MADLPPHGTYARYEQEKRAGEGTCDACKAVNRDYVRLWRMLHGPGQWGRRKCAAGLGWPK